MEAGKVYLFLGKNKKGWCETMLIKFTVGSKKTAKGNISVKSTYFSDLENAKAFFHENIFARVLKVTVDGEPVKGNELAKLLGW
jgi:hypothetical protein